MSCPATVRSDSTVEETPAAPGLSALIENNGIVMTTKNDQIFEAEQVVARHREEVFAFFADPKNLETITPPWLRFEITGASDSEIREGTLLDYKLRMRGLPIRWRSLIDVWEPGRRFVDIQVRGPYDRWHHTHTFEDVEGGTRVGDRVIYRLPLGRLGRFLAGRFVRRDVEKIFDFRRERIRQILEEGAAERRSET